MTKQRRCQREVPHEETHCYKEHDQVHLSSYTLLYFTALSGYLEFNSSGLELEYEVGGLSPEAFNSIFCYYLFATDLL